jgi:hypothetical protein
VLPDEQVLEQADRGNLVPMGAEGPPEDPIAALMRAAGGVV